MTVATGVTTAVAGGLIFLFRRPPALLSSGVPPFQRGVRHERGTAPPKTSVFRVMLGETGWMVREDGGADDVRTPRAREAVREAQRLAQEKAVARVIVHYADATVERQILFHGEPRSARTWREGDVQRSGSEVDRVERAALAVVQADGQHLRPGGDRPAAEELQAFAGRAGSASCPAGTADELHLRAEGGVERRGQERARVQRPGDELPEGIEVREARARSGW